MGAKQTKVEEICAEEVSELASHQSKAIELEAMKVEGKAYVHQGTPPRAVENLRKRIFKGFTYNLNDPRSPSLFLNRTPLVFEDSIDKPLNLDDTFSDLFVASRSPADTAAENDQKDLKANDSASIEFTSLVEDETMPCTAVLQHTPLLLQQALDPRSPAIGRTPIVFDDDEATEEAMLEDILATLSLEFGESASPITAENKKPPVNKPLDRLRSKKPEKPIRKTKNAQKQRIYLDCENVNVTPKRKQLINGVVDTAEKRTPLSCVKNRVHHLRSRSVESNGKSPKQKLSLTSYDDNLNPAEDRKVVNLHALQGDFFDF